MLRLWLYAQDSRRAVSTHNGHRDCGQLHGSETRLDGIQTISCVHLCASGHEVIVSALQDCGYGLGKSSRVYRSVSFSCVKIRRRECDFLNIWEMNIPLSKVMNIPLSKVMNIPLSKVICC
jgi:hypothetical protein